jgi:hypothetical protein
VRKLAYILVLVAGCATAPADDTETVLVAAAVEFSDPYPPPPVAPMPREVTAPSSRSE